MQKALLCVLMVLGCDPVPNLPPPPQAEVRQWYKDCKNHTAELTHDIGIMQSDGLIAMASPSAKVARYQRSECGGSWAVVLLSPTGMQNDAGLWLYGPTDLAPPFSVP